MCLHHWSWGMNQVCHLLPSDKVLTKGHPSYLILLWKSRQQLYLVSSELMSLTEDCPNCSSWYSEFSASSSGWLLGSMNKRCSDSVHMLFTCWWLARAELADKPLFRRLLYHHLIRLLWLWILLRWCSELSLNCSHRFWIMKPETELSFLLLWHHFRLTMVTALQRPISELLHVTVNLELFLYMYQVVWLL
jgi:hypothetical protein